MMMHTYLETVERAVAQTDTAALERVVDVLEHAFLEGRRVYVFGNGASAALASHAAGDLGKFTAKQLGAGPEIEDSRRLRITSLNDNAAWITALGNDVAYRDVFLEQLKNHLEPRDVVWGISGSGGSENVLRALEYARGHGGVTIGFTGAMPSSQRMAALCDVLVRAPCAMLEQIEDLHVMYHHLVTRSLVSRIGG
jgi:D-sedoheptulose 7-phosphate isomerase